MPDLFSGLTGALTAARTGQLQGQNEGELQRIALQIQIEDMARRQRSQDIADRAEQARAGYYQNEADRNDTIQRRQDALAGIVKETPVDPNLAPAAGDLGITLPKNLHETGVGTDSGDVMPVTSLGKGEVYDPTKNLQYIQEQAREKAAMDRVEAQQRGAGERTSQRINMGPNGVRTADAQNFAKSVISLTAYYAKPHPSEVGGINVPGLPPAEATNQAIIAAASAFPEEAMRRYPHRQDVQAAAQKALATRRNGAGAPSAPPKTSGFYTPPSLPGAAAPTSGIPGVPTAPTGQVRQNVVSAVVKHLQAHPELVSEIDTAALSDAERKLIRQQLGLEE